MRKWLSSFTDFPEFLWAVLDHWRELVMGSLIMAGVWYGQNVLGMAIPNAFNLSLAVIFLLLGTFGAWRDKKGMADKATADLHAHASRQRTAQELRTFGDSFLGLYEEGIGIEKATHLSNPILPQVLSMVAEWQDRIQERLQGKILPARWLEYKLIKGSSPHTLEFVLALVFDPYQQGKHRCEMMPEQLQFLHQIIDNPSAFMLPK